VLWGERIFVTSSGEQFHISCLRSSDGSTAWQKTFPAPQHALHANNSYASATPATDGGHVFVPRIADGELVLTALSHEGDLAWEYRAGPFKTEHGLGHSPVVWQNLVFLVNDQDLAGQVLALDAATGRLLWQAPRSPGRSDYSTPCVLERGHEAGWLVVNSHEDGICGFDLRTGALAWASSRSILGMRSVSSPLATAGLILGTCGSGGGGNYVVALHPPEHAPQSPTLAYEVRRAAPYVPTPIAIGELLFLWNDGGIVTCVDAATGAQHWQERVGGNFFSSPVSVDGKIYNTSTTGEVVVLAPSKEFKLLGRSSLGERTHATPAIANSCLYFRTFRHLTCIGMR
jgi:outer membrane protein assembly factor BamB